MKTHDEMVSGWMENPKFRKDYEALEDELREWDEKLKSRRASDNKALNADPQRRDENLVVE